jgi:transcriptional regulator with XRE-family HTH domain
LREKKGLSQAKLAGAAGVDPTSLARVERGETDPGFGWLQKIAAVLGKELTFVDPESRVVEDDGQWSGAVQAYLRTKSGASTAPWVAAQLATTKHSHLEGETDLMLAVHDARRQIELAALAPDATEKHPKLDTPPRKKR